MGQVTKVIAGFEAGDPEVTRRLFSLVYEELRSIAQQKLRQERSGHLLQPTALVNEAFLKLVNSNGICWNNRLHFFRAAARAMNRILVDQARKRASLKRGGPNKVEVPLEGVEPIEEPIDSRLIELNEALEQLDSYSSERAWFVCIFLPV